MLDHVLNRYVAWSETPKIRILHAAVNAPGHTLSRDDAIRATRRRLHIRAERDLVALVAWGWLEPADDGQSGFRMPEDRVEDARRLVDLCPYV